MKKRRSPLYGEAGYRRREHDDYRTHPAYTAGLAAYLGRRMIPEIWEPACGAGDIVRALQRFGATVTASDLRSGQDRLFGRGGVDFLARPRLPGICRAIWTNPPYKDGLVARFLEHAIALTKAVAGQVAMFLRMEWFATETARPFVNRPPFAGFYPVFPRPN